MLFDTTQVRKQENTELQGYGTAQLDFELSVKPDKYYLKSVNHTFCRSGVEYGAMHGFVMLSLTNWVSLHVAY